MPVNYFSDPHTTKAERLDLAWKNYQDQTLSQAERRKALDFMIYVFDIKDKSSSNDHLNERLGLLMCYRERHKSENPDYIPIYRTGGYQLNAKVLDVTSNSRVSSDPTIQQQFAKKELLDVNMTNKLLETGSHEVTYLTPNQREKYDTEIFNGHFYQSGQLFDSSKKQAHGKMGYVAFTLNANGVLSTFEHLSGEKNSSEEILVHSSMNAGAPVLAAGEMEIKNGKLISINTHSGHYQPSLYTVARFLEYLSDRGVDISQTNVYLQTKPKQLPSEVVLVRGNFNPYYKVPATTIVITVKQMMDNHIKLVNDYIHSPKTMLLRSLFGPLTRKKSALATKCQKEIQEMMQEIKNSSSLVVTHQSLDRLDAILTKYSNQLAGLSRKQGRLMKKMDVMKKQVTQLKESVENKTTDSTRIEGFKNDF